MSNTLTEQQFAEYVERAESDLRYWKDRAEKAERECDELRKVLGRIAKESRDYQYIARAALEAKP